MEISSVIVLAVGVAALSISGWRWVRAKLDLKRQALKRKEDEEALRWACIQFSEATFIGFMPDGYLRIVLPKVSPKEPSSN